MSICTSVRHDWSDTIDSGGSGSQENLTQIHVELTYLTDQFGAG